MKHEPITNRRILIVDDQEMIHADFRKILGVTRAAHSTLEVDEALLFGEPPSTAIGSTAGYEIDSAFQGQEGVALVEQSIAAGNPYAVAFIDVRMPPGWDGVETTERIWEVDPDLQVVMCTAQSNYTWEQTADRLGRTDRLLILKKPFDAFTVRQFAASLTKKWCLVRELNEQLNRFRAQIEQTRRIIDTSNDAFVSFDEDDHIIEWSRRAELLFGRTRDQVLDRPLTSYLLPLSAQDESLDALKRELVATDEGRRCHMSARRHDGGQFVVELSLSYMQLDESLVFTAFIHDVSEKERQQKQALHAQKMQSVGILAAGIAKGIDSRTREIEQQLGEMLAAMEGLELIQQCCCALVAACEQPAVDHEAIETAGEQLADPRLDFIRSRGRQSAEQTLCQVNEIANIVGALQEFAHPGGDEAAAIDLNHVVASMVSICQGNWKESVEFELNLDFELPLLICRPVELNQAILYLILNATEAVAKHQPSATGRNILITTHRDGDSIVLRISDDGPQFTEEVRRHLFTRTLPADCSPGRSTQGLAPVASIIVDRHKGSITYETDAPHSSTINIRLPLLIDATLPSARTNKPSYPESMQMKTHILFVDDDENVLNGLRRSLRSWSDQWETHFVTSGREALDHADRQAPDVIVSDYQMPDMNGAQLLGQIQTRFPNTIRIIVSDHVSDEALFNSVSWAHQFLTKPYNVDTLQNAVNRACSLRVQLNDEALQQIVNQITALPSLPHLYQQVVEELKSEDTSLERIGGIISQDVAMTAKILQLVNSSFFGLAQTVHDPAQAAALIGLKMLKPLVLVVGIFEQFREIDGFGFSLDALLDHSVAVGTKARDILRQRDFRSPMVEDGFVGGMLHDVGKLVLAANCRQQYREALSMARDQSIPLHVAEQQILGTTHAQVGGYLLGLWKFSDLVIEAVTFHHLPSASANFSFSPLTGVHLADAICHSDDTPNSGPSSELVDLEYLSRVGVAVECVSEAAELVGVGSHHVGCRG